jgi:hypothetical protein
MPARYTNAKAIANILNAKSGSRWSLITVEGGHTNGDCGQQVMVA